MLNLSELDFIADDEVVDDEADPAEGEDCDAEDELPEDVEFGLLEDVNNAPDRGDEADDVNDSS